MQMAMFKMDLLIHIADYQFVMEPMEVGRPEHVNDHKNFCKLMSNGSQLLLRLPDHFQFAQVQMV